MPSRVMPPSGQVQELVWGALAALLGATGWEVEKVCATDTPFGVLLATAVD
jgi:hypothetical protein